MRRDRRGSVSRDLRRAADCSPGLWRIIKLAEESLRAPRRGGQLGWLVILSLSLSSLELCPPLRPFREWSCKLLPPFQAKRDRKAAHRTLRFFPFSFLSFLSSPPLLPSFLIPPSSLVAVGTTLMPTECNRRKFPLGDFSTQND